MIDGSAGLAAALCSKDERRRLSEDIHTGARMRRPIPARRRPKAFGTGSGWSIASLSAAEREIARIEVGRRKLIELLMNGIAPPLRVHTEPVKSAPATLST